MQKILMHQRLSFKSVVNWSIQQAICSTNFQKLVAANSQLQNLQERQFESATTFLSVQYKSYGLRDNVSK